MKIIGDTLILLLTILCPVALITYLQRIQVLKFNNSYAIFIIAGAITAIFYISVLFILRKVLNLDLNDNKTVISAIIQAVLGGLVAALLMPIAFSTLFSWVVLDGYNLRNFIYFICVALIAKSHLSVLSIYRKKLS